MPMRFFFKDCKHVTVYQLIVLHKPWKLLISSFWNDEVISLQKAVTSQSTVHIHVSYKNIIPSVSLLSSKKPILECHWNHFTR